MLKKQKFGHVYYSPIIERFTSCTVAYEWKEGQSPTFTKHAVLVKRFPKHLLHKFQRDPRTNLEGNTKLQQFSSIILKDYFRRDHTRRLKTSSGASESKTSNTCEEHIEGCKVGAQDWLVQNVELSKDFAFANYQIHQTAVFMPINERKWRGRLRWWSPHSSSRPA